MSSNDKLNRILQQIEQQNRIIEQQSKVLESFHEDLDWLKENTATKKDLAAERGYTRKIVREEIDSNNQMLGTVLKIELAESKKEIIAGVNKGFQEIASELTDHKERIDILEENAELKPHKN